MAKLTTFNFITLDGYFKGPNNDISWHRHGGEEAEFSLQNMSLGHTILLGRVTYEMMAGFWQSPQAAATMPEMARHMNDANKIVFSNTLSEATWKNTRIIKSNIAEEVRKLKLAEERDMTILGSGTIITLFTEHNLIDEYQLMVDPVAIGNGTPIFKGITRKLDLELTHSKKFLSGVILLCYVPRGEEE